MSKKTKIEDSPSLNILQEMKLLSFQLIVKENTIQELTETVQKHKNINSEILDELNKNKLAKSVMLQNDRKIKTLQESCLNFEKEKLILQEEIKNLRKTFQEEKENLVKEYENKMSKLKFEYELLKTRIDNVISIEKTNIQQEKYIKELEEKLVDKNKEYLMKLDKKTLKNQIKFTEMKQKLIETIGKAEKNVDRLNVQHYDSSSKITLLQNHSLLIELGFQSQQIEEVLNRNKFLERKNFDLIKEIEIHQEVENSLVNMNSDLRRTIENLKSEIIIEKKNGDTEKNHESVDYSKEKDKKIFFKKLNLIDRSKSNNNFQTHETKGEARHNTSRNTTLNLLENVRINPDLQRNKSSMFDDTRDTLKHIQNKKKEYEILSQNYKNLQEKFKYFSKKFHNFFKLFDLALTKLINNSEFKELSIVAEDINDGNFDKISDDKKYLILNIFIKILVEIVNFSDLGKEYIIKKNGQNIPDLIFDTKNKKEDVKKKGLTVSNEKIQSKYYYTLHRPIIKDLPNIVYNRSSLFQ